MPDADRQPARLRERIAALTLESLGREAVGFEPIAAGLGSRRFLRIRLAPGATAGTDARGEPQTLVARIEAEEDPALRPAGISPEPPLEPIRALLERSGLPVPACHAIAPELMLLEDVGSESLEAAATNRAQDELHGLYREACELLPRLQSIERAPGIEAFERRLDDDLIRYKAEQVVEWALPWQGRKTSPAEADVVREAFAFVASTVREAPARLSHRDFKAANLHLREPARADGSRLTMIDLQGAFLAPPEYDLVCLLRDSHVALDEAFVQATLEVIRPALPDAPEPDVFWRRFTLLTLTRNGKDLSRYLYALKVRGDTRYAALLPRALHTLQAAATQAAAWDPVLARLAEVIESLPEPMCAQ
jgi:aminoglycoside/choline kinase family phosphotransferase